MQSSSPASLPELTPKQHLPQELTGPVRVLTAAQRETWYLVVALPQLRESHMGWLDDLSSLAEKGSKLAVVLVIAAFFDWKKVYNVIGIAHVGQIPTVVRCAQVDFEIGNIESNLLEISFTKEMCNGTFEKKSECF